MGIPWSSEIAAVTVPVSDVASRTSTVARPSPAGSIPAPGDPMATVRVSPSLAPTWNVPE